MTNRTTYQQEYYQRNKEHIRELTKGYRLANPERYRAYDKKCRDKYRNERREYEKLRKRRVKLEVVTHYGNGTAQCVVCGEDRLPCLTLDHVNNDGAQHRRDTGLTGGSAMYLWVKRKGFPKIFQTLCMNCQGMKHYYEKERT